MTLQENIDRLEALQRQAEELRRRLEACDSPEEAADLVTQFDAVVKDLIEAIDAAKREADAQP